MNYLIIATGSFLFCTKGVIAKLCYNEGLDTLDVMLLRMLMALPFFLTLTILGSIGKPSLSLQEWAALITLGFSGYYLTSYLDFKGLEYIDVSLERMILFTYPLLILALGCIGKAKTKITKRHWASAFLVWVGIALVFGSYQSVNRSIDQNTVIGSLFVFASAFLFAIYTLNSKQWIERIGVARFTGTVMSVSACCVIIHNGFAKGGAVSLDYPSRVYLYGGIIAFFGTFLPSFLTVLGLKRTSPQASAIIGSIGPVSAVFLATLVLKERTTPLLIIGFIVSLLGTLVIQIPSKQGKSVK